MFCLKTKVLCWTWWKDFMNGCSNYCLTSRWSACHWWAASCRCSGHVPGPISPLSHSRTAPAPWLTLNGEETSECSHNGSPGKDQSNFFHHRITWVMQQFWFGTQFLLLNSCPRLAGSHHPHLKSDASKSGMFLILNSFTLLRSIKSLLPENPFPNTLMNQG